MKTSGLTFIIAASIFGAGVAGCGGGNTDGGSQSFDGQIFSTSDETVGRVEIKLQADRMPVGETTGFQAYAFDSNGNPIKDLRIVCDSEAGVKILEPVLGEPPRAVQMTNSMGAISGVIGCEDPGSFKFGCRMPVRAGRRQFVDIHCTGEKPVGFDGFTNAAGGTLGGGTVDPNDQGKGDLRLTKVQIRGYTSGGSLAETDQIDVTREQCITCADLSSIDEPFTDDYAVLTVKSSTTSRVTITGVQYEVAGVGRSEMLPVTLEIPAAPKDGDSEASFSVLVFRASSPGKDFIIGKGKEIPDNTGFKSVTFTVFGETALGEVVKASGATTLSFQSYNVCPSGTVLDEAQCPTTEDTGA